MVDFASSVLWIADLDPEGVRIYVGRLHGVQSLLNNVDNTSGVHAISGLQNCRVNRCTFRHSSFWSQCTRWLSLADFPQHLFNDGHVS